MKQSNIHIEQFRRDFLLLTCDDSVKLRHFGKALYHHNFHFVDEVIVSETEVMLKLNEHFKSSDMALIHSVQTDSEILPQQFDLPVCFEFGNDWAAVEHHAGIPKKEIIKALCESEFSVAMFGFLPGFLYMNGLPKYLQVPRKAVPAKYIEPNSVAIGGPYLGLYSLPSPAGWHVIGRTPASVLLKESVPPVKVNLFDTVKLIEITTEEYEQLKV